MPMPGPFVARQDRLQGALLRHLANATIQRAQGGAVQSALYDSALPEGSPFGDVATVARHWISTNVATLSGLAEGVEIIATTRAWPAGQRCRIATPVVPDAGGWATFDVVPVPVVRVP